jgi:hypothetical protein
MTNVLDSPTTRLSVIVVEIGCSTMARTIVPAVWTIPVSSSYVTGVEIDGTDEIVNVVAAADSKSSSGDIVKTRWCCVVVSG